MNKIGTVLMLLLAVSIVMFGQQQLDPQNYITLDNAPNLPQGGSADTPEYKEVGPWYNGTTANAVGGSYRQTSQLGGESIAGRFARWTLVIPPGKQGHYVIYTYVLQAANNASSVYYTLQNEFETTVMDSVRHDLRRSAITDASVGTGAWVPLMMHNLNVGNYFITVGADSFSGSAIMRADGIRVLRSSSANADLEFGRRHFSAFETNRVVERWLDAPLGSITYKEIPLYNLGQTDLIINAVSVAKSANRWDIKVAGGGSFPLVIPPGSTKSLAVGFRPFEEEVVQDSLIIESNDSLELKTSIPIYGNGINYNFMMNASLSNELNYNAPFDKLGDSKKPLMNLVGSWAESGTGVSSFPYPIPAGNRFGIYNPPTDPGGYIEYKFQLPDSVNGIPGSSGYYTIEYGAFPFSDNSEENVQVKVVPAFSIDTIIGSFSQRNLTVPPYFVPVVSKPMYLNQGDYTTVRFGHDINAPRYLRADLLRIKKVPTAPTIQATNSVIFGNVSIYEHERLAADNYRLDMEISSGGESKLVIDSITISNPRYYSIVNMPQFPLELAAVSDSKKLTVRFIPDTIANTLSATLRIYSNDSTKRPYNVALSGNGVGSRSTIEEVDPQGAYLYPANPVIYPDFANMQKWQQVIDPNSSGGSRLVGYIYKLEGDPTTQTKTSYVEYFPLIPVIPGRGPELDTFRVYARMTIGSSNSSPRAKYTIFPAGGGDPVETVLNQNGRGERVFLGNAVFLRSGTRDAHGGGAINGFIRLENDTTLVSEYYKDSLVNRARRDTFVLRADAIILEETLTGVGYEIYPNVPSTYNLTQNFPNPFNPVTKIGFDLPEAVNVELSIYDILGRQVRNLINQQYDQGSYAVTWDGKNNAGARVASGVYIYRLQAGNFIATKKMVMMK